MRKHLSRILSNAFGWAVVCGLLGASMGVVTTLVAPDTGHIPRKMVPVMMGVPFAVLGAIAGLLFACILVPREVFGIVWTTGRVILGGVVGGAVAMISMNLVTKAPVAILSASLLGAVLGVQFAKARSPQKEGRVRSHGKINAQ